MEKILGLFCLLEMVKHVIAKTQPGLIESLILAANSRPWLWSIYVFTVGLPMILFISFMWPDKRFGPPDQPYYYKKSDEEQEDDPEHPPLSTKHVPAKQDKATETGARKRGA
ncbi:calnexin-like [Periophthalmus magnuspinnatus]|uniref:calnexin-like n=1 Tax=Periophthalmus magnuspinnatus TaxID=409849 RepID=UPI00145A43BE|nr:calnexin-like [Periophthalmus magnuspinnatus]